MKKVLGQALPVTDDNAPIAMGTTEAQNKKTQDDYTPSSTEFMDAVISPLKGKDFELTADDVTKEAPQTEQKNTDEVTNTNSNPIREPLHGQVAVIAGWLKYHGRLSTEEAGRMGILAKSLTARICDLRQRGWVIDTIMTEQDAGYGIKKELPLYVLKEIPLFDRGN